jgi:hypothetical protein
MRVKGGTTECILASVAGYIHWLQFTFVVDRLTDEADVEPGQK